MFGEHQIKFLFDLLNSDKQIIVEGKKDRKVLEMVGLKNIVEISGKQLEKVADIVNDKRSDVVILTDFDKEGMKQYKRLKSLFHANGVKINDNIRRDFKRVFLVNRIEEISSHFK